MIDVFITSSSRPELFPFMWESFKKMCIIRQGTNVVCNEDTVFPQKTERLKKWLLKLQKRGEIQHLNINPNPSGLGHALDVYLRQRKEFLRNKYCLYLQEDWEFERPIDIDQITWTMDKHPHINLIFFNKIKNSGSINKQRQEERDFSGLKCCVYHGWTFLPGIWRTDFVRRHWVRTTYKPEGFFTNQFGSHETRTPVNYCEKKIGAYIYGRQGEHRYVRHLGNNWRMAQWRLEPAGDKGQRKKPGGNHNPKTMDLPYMAPWVPYPERPVQGKAFNEQKIRKMLEEI